jgi:hypothetical protein
MSAIWYLLSGAKCGTSGCVRSYILGQPGITCNSGEAVGQSVESGSMYTVSRPMVQVTMKSPLLARHAVVAVAETGSDTPASI